MITETMEAELDSVKTDLRELRKDLRTLIQTVGNEQGQRLSAVRGRIAERAQQRLDRARQAAHEARAAGLKAKTQAEEYVRARPLETVLAAAAVGAVLGRLMQHRRI
jgi:ElaB/YqjD/DUF883 family membrane-anchored ribosome-binding protein